MSRPRQVLQDLSVNDHAHGAGRPLQGISWRGPPAFDLPLVHAAGCTCANCKSRAPSTAGPRPAPPGGPKSIRLFRPVNALQRGVPSASTASTPTPSSTVVGIEAAPAAVYAPQVGWHSGPHDKHASISPSHAYAAHRGPNNYINQYLSPPAAPSPPPHPHGQYGRSLFPQAIPQSPAWGDENTGLLLLSPTFPHPASPQSPRHVPSSFPYTGYPPGGALVNTPVALRWPTEPQHIATPPPTAHPAVWGDSPSFQRSHADAHHHPATRPHTRPLASFASTSALSTVFGSTASPHSSSASSYSSSSSSYARWVRRRRATKRASRDARRRRDGSSGTRSRRRRHERGGRRDTPDAALASMRSTGSALFAGGEWTPVKDRHSSFAAARPEGAGAGPAGSGGVGGLAARAADWTAPGRHASSHAGSRAASHDGNRGDSHAASSRGPSVVGVGSRHASVAATDARAATADGQSAAAAGRRGSLASTRTGAGAGTAMTGSAATGTPGSRAATVSSAAGDSTIALPPVASADTDGGALSDAAPTDGDMAASAESLRAAAGTATAARSLAATPAGTPAGSTRGSVPPSRAPSAVPSRAGSRAGSHASPTGSALNHDAPARPGDAGSLGAAGVGGANTMTVDGGPGSRRGSVSTMDAALAAGTAEGAAHASRASDATGSRGSRAAGATAAAGTAGGPLGGGDTPDGSASRGGGGGRSRAASAASAGVSVRARSAGSDASYVSVSAGDQEHAESCSDRDACHDPECGDDVCPDDLCDAGAQPAVRGGRAPAGTASSTTRQGLPRLHSSPAASMISGGGGDTHQSGQPQRSQRQQRRLGATTADALPSPRPPLGAPPLSPPARNRLPGAASSVPTSALSSPHGSRRASVADASPDHPHPGRGAARAAGPAAQSAPSSRAVSSSPARRRDPRAGPGASPSRESTATSLASRGRRDARSASPPAPGSPPSDRHTSGAANPVGGRHTAARAGSRPSPRAPDSVEPASPAVPRSPAGPSSRSGRPVPDAGARKEKGEGEGAPRGRRAVRMAESHSDTSSSSSRSSSNSSGDSDAPRSSRKGPARSQRSTAKAAKTKRSERGFADARSPHPRGDGGGRGGDVADGDAVRLSSLEPSGSPVVSGRQRQARSPSQSSSLSSSTSSSSSSSESRSRKRRRAKKDRKDRRKRSRASRSDRDADKADRHDQGGRESASARGRNRSAGPADDRGAILVEGDAGWGADRSRRDRRRPSRASTGGGWSRDTSRADRSRDGAGTSFLRSSSSSPRSSSRVSEQTTSSGGYDSRRRDPAGTRSDRYHPYPTSNVYAAHDHGGHGRPSSRYPSYAPYRLSGTAASRAASIIDHTVIPPPPGDHGAAHPSYRGERDSWEHGGWDQGPWDGAAVAITTPPRGVVGSSSNPFTGVVTATSTPRRTGRRGSLGGGVGRADSDATPQPRRRGVSVRIGDVTAEDVDSDSGQRYGDAGRYNPHTDDHDGHGRDGGEHQRADRHDRERGHTRAHASPTVGLALGRGLGPHVAPITPPPALIVPRRGASVPMGAPSPSGIVPLPGAPILIPGGCPPVAVACTAGPGGVGVGATPILLPTAIPPSLPPVMATCGNAVACAVVSTTGAGAVAAAVERATAYPPHTTAVTYSAADGAVARHGGQHAPAGAYDGAYGDPYQAARFSGGAGDISTIGSTARLLQGSPFPLPYPHAPAVSLPGGANAGATVHGGEAGAAGGAGAYGGPGAVQHPQPDAPYGHGGAQTHSGTVPAGTAGTATSGGVGRVVITHGTLAGALALTAPTVIRSTSQHHFLHGVPAGIGAFSSVAAVDLRPMHRMSSLPPAGGYVWPPRTYTATPDDSLWGRGPHRSPPQQPPQQSQQQQQRSPQQQQQQQRSPQPQRQHQSPPPPSSPHLSRRHDATAHAPPSGSSSSSPPRTSRASSRPPRSASVATYRPASRSASARRQDTDQQQYQQQQQSREGGRPPGIPTSAPLGPYGAFGAHPRHDHEPDHAWPPAAVAPVGSRVASTAPPLSDASGPSHGNVGGGDQRTAGSPGSHGRDGDRGRGLSRTLTGDSWRSPSLRRDGTPQRIYDQQQQQQQQRATGMHASGRAGSESAGRSASRGRARKPRADSQDAIDNGSGTPPPSLWLQPDDDHDDVRDDYRDRSLRGRREDDTTDPPPSRGHSARRSHTPVGPAGAPAHAHAPSHGRRLGGAGWLGSEADAHDQMAAPHPRGGRRDGGHEAPVGLHDGRTMRGAAGSRTGGGSVRRGKNDGYDISDEDDGYLDDDGFDRHRNSTAMEPTIAARGGRGASTNVAPNDPRTSGSGNGSIHPHASRSRSRSHSNARAGGDGPATRDARRDSPSRASYASLDASTGAANSLQRPSRADGRARSGSAGGASGIRMALGLSRPRRYTDEYDGTHDAFGDAGNSGTRGAGAGPATTPPSTPPPTRDPQHGGHHSADDEITRSPRDGPDARAARHTSPRNAIPHSHARIRESPPLQRSRFTLTKPRSSHASAPIPPPPRILTHPPVQTPPRRPPAGATAHAGSPQRGARFASPGKGPAWAMLPVSTLPATSTSLAVSPESSGPGARGRRRGASGPLVSAGTSAPFAGPHAGAPDARQIHSLREGVTARDRGARQGTGVVDGMQRVPLGRAQGSNARRQGARTPHGGEGGAAGGEYHLDHGIPSRHSPVGLGRDAGGADRGWLPDGHDSGRPPHSSIPTPPRSYRTPTSVAPAGSGGGAYPSVAPTPAHIDRPMLAPPPARAQQAEARTGPPTQRAQPSHYQRQDALSGMTSPSAIRNVTASAAAEVDTAAAALLGAVWGSATTAPPRGAAHAQRTKSDVTLPVDQQPHLRPSFHRPPASERSPAAQRAFARREAAAAAALEYRCERAAPMGGGAGHGPGPARGLFRPEPAPGSMARGGPGAGHSRPTGRAGSSTAAALAAMGSH